MLAAAIVVFREIIEAGLVVGIVLAVTQGVAGRARYVAGGVTTGILGACLLALCADKLSAALSGNGQEIFNALVLAAAVVMLVWHNIWMARHGAELVSELKATGNDVATGLKPLMDLAVVVGIAVLREGSEIVLFIYGIAVAGNDSSFSLLAGSALGLICGAALSLLTYGGLVIIPSRYIFGVTSTIIAFLAAGMASQCVLFLQRADLVSVLHQQFWDSSWLLPMDSLLGKAMHALVGYDDRPSAMQMTIYAATLVLIFIAMRLFSNNQGNNARHQNIGRSMKLPNGIAS